MKTSRSVSRSGKNKIELILARIQKGQYAPPAPLGRKEGQRRRRDAEVARWKEGV